MEVNWRVGAAFAGVAFILSILIGAIAGVGFGLILLRAIVGAAAFAVVGAGVSLVIARYLPDLNSLFGTSQRQSAEKQEESGRKVDIVLPEDQDSLQYGPESEEEDEEDSPSFGGDMLVEEVEESSSDATGSTDGGRKPSQSVRSGGVPSDVVGDEEAAELLDADVDDLPDIGGFSSSFEQSSESSGTAMDSFGSVSSNDRRPSSVDPADPGDPETIARALRTVLNRDQS